jgi:acetylornithine deacetylase
MTSPHASLASVRDILARLIAFDTTSRDSNLHLIEWVEGFLAPCLKEGGGKLLRLPNEDGTKANLWVRFGPDKPGGVVLSGHTDVVPVDGQPWVTSPWELTDKAGVWHGRGACDMKGFIALCLAHAKAFATMDLKIPVHFAFSYDEEVGCAGVTPMIEAIAASPAAPSIVWVGEPTLWGVTSAHKGIRDYEVTITGKDGHSSKPALGASAIHEAIELLAVLRRIAREAEANPPRGGADFDPAYPTLTIGLINGGTAANILARQCRFVFDLRSTPGLDEEKMLAPFFEEVEKVRSRLAPYGPECGVVIDKRADAPALERRPDSPAERLLRDLTGDNATRVVPFATEAGQFQRAGMSAVICGPGSIDQAHQPNEFVAVSEIERGLAIFQRFIARVRA